MSTERQNIKKCPVCGAHAQSLSFMCPYCGYIFQDDTYTSKETRELLTGLQSTLLAIDNSNNKLDDIATQKATVINAFSVPNTLDAIVQVLILSFSNIAASKKSQRRVLTKAWIAKAINCYKLLEVQSDDSKQIRNLLEKYSVLGKADAMEILDGTLAQKKRIKYISIFFLATLLSFGVFLLYSHNSIKYNVNHGHLQRTLALIDELDNQESIESAFSLLEKLPNVVQVTTYSYDGDTCIMSICCSDKENILSKQLLSNGGIFYESHSFNAEKSKDWEWYDTLGVRRKLPEVEDIEFIYDPVSMLYSRLLSENPLVSIDKNGHVSKLIVSGKISPESECFRCESEFFYQNNDLVKISNKFSPPQFEGHLDNIYFENHVNTSDLSECNYYTLSQREREKVFVYTEYLFSRIKPYNLRTRTKKYVFNIDYFVKDHFGVDEGIDYPPEIYVSIDSTSVKRGKNLIVTEFYEPCLDESGELSHFTEKVISKLLDMIQNISSIENGAYHIEKFKSLETITLVRDDKKVKQVALSFTKSLDSY